MPTVTDVPDLPCPHLLVPSGTSLLLQPGLHCAGEIGLLNPWTGSHKMLPHHTYNWWQSRPQAPWSLQGPCLARSLPSRAKYGVMWWALTLQSLPLSTPLPRFNQVLPGEGRDQLSHLAYAQPLSPTSQHNSPSPPEGKNMPVLHLAHSPCSTGPQRGPQWFTALSFPCSPFWPKKSLFPGLFNPCGLRATWVRQ